MEELVAETPITESKKKHKGPKKDGLKKNVIFNIVYQVLIVVVPFITAPYVSRVLEPDGIGIFEYTNSLATFFTMFAAFGILSYGTMVIAQKRDDKRAYSQTFWEIEIIAVALSLIATATWLVFSTFYTEYKIYMYILSFHIIATCFDISWLYAGLEKFKYTIVINAAIKILSMLAIFLFVKTKDDLVLYILITSLALLIGNLTMWLFLFRVLGKTKIELKNLKTHLKETFVFFVPTIATTIYSVLDKALIGVLIQGTDENGNKIADLENGYYGQAMKILNAVKAIAFMAINNVMCSRASFLYQKKDQENIDKLRGNTFHLTLFLSIGACFGLIGIAPIFSPLFFGEGYDKTVILMQLLSVILPIICISNVLGSVYYTPSGRRKQSSIYLIIGSGVNLVLNIPCILLFKSIGAAAASIAAELIITILYVGRSKRTTTVSDLFGYLFKKVLAGFAMLTAIIGVNKLLEQYQLNTIVLLVLLFFVGVVVYLFFLILLRDDSYLIVKEGIKKKLGKFLNKNKSSEVVESLPEGVQHES